MDSKVKRYAPIVVFGFNRPDALRACISSLLANDEAKESDLIVYIDGPRTEKNGEIEMVKRVRDYAKSISGFNSLELHFSNVNRKLGASIIAGVSDVINRYGRAIVIEDDLIASRNMISYLNHALDTYEDKPEVFSISAYSNKLKIPSDYYFDSYFCVRSSSWGWATWKDRWNSVDWELNDWEKVERNANAFNKWGGSDCFYMLNGWKKGQNQSWAIRFCYAQFVQNKVSLFPIKSKIYNKGFDGSGTNCKKWNRFKTLFDLTNNKIYNFPSSTRINASIHKQFKSYYSIPVRIFSRFMNFIYEL